MKTFPFSYFSLRFKTSEHRRSTKNLVYDTLEFAAQLNFRPGVSKNFVVLTCSSLSDGKEYAHILTMLRSHSIVLHHMTSEDIVLKERSMRQKKTGILGYNAEETFSKEHMSRTEGDRAMRRHLQVSKDYLSTLALASQGTVFSHSGDRAKLARTVMAQQVARRAEPVACQICDCMPDRDGEGHLQCQRCMAQEFEFILQDLPEN